MTRSGLLSTILAIALAPLTEAADPAFLDLDLTIRLYDYAKPGDAILSRAKREAQRALAKIGVAVRCLDCPLTMEERQGNKACVVALGPAELVLRLLPPGSKPAVTSPVDTFGYALIGESEMPRTASVLFGNVERLAWQRLEDSSFDSLHRSIPHQRYVGVLLGYVSKRAARTVSTEAKG